MYKINYELLKYLKFTRIKKIFKFLLLTPVALLNVIGAFCP